MTLDPRCCETTSVSKVKVEEKGRKAVFLNQSRKLYQKIRIDDCVVSGGQRADWVISEAGLGDVIVELKGKDVDHAVKQVEETIKLWKRKKYCGGKLAALIVSSQFPKINTSVRRAKEKLAKDYSAPLHVVNGSYEGSLDCVLSFKGPYKV